MLIEIYGAHGYVTVDAVKNIVTKNLYGLDIDERAAQLAYFTVMMKARAYDRGFFRRSIQPNVYAIVESNWIGGAYPYDMGDFLLAEEHRKTLNYLLEAFRDAKEYGSLIRLEPHDYAGLLRAWEQTAAATAPNFNMVLWYDAVKEEIPKLLRQAHLLFQKYHIVVTNPPYMGSKGMGAKLARFVKEQYPDSKSDLFAAFIERCNAWCVPNGYSSLVTMQSWMFLSSFEKMRKDLLTSKTIMTLMHMENMVMGIAFGTAVSVLKNVHLEGFKGIYHQIKLCDIVDDVPVEFPVKRNRFAQIAAESFEKIPGFPIAYSMSENFLVAYRVGCPLGDIAEPKAGMSTGNNEIFERYWHEVSFPRIGFHYRDAQETRDCRYQWVPCNSGGEYRKWAFNNEIIVNWYNDGEEIRAYRNASGKIASATRNTAYYFKVGLTWNKLSSSRFAVKYKAEGFAFDDTSRSIFLEDGGCHALFYLLGLLCSNVTFAYLAALNPTMSFTNNDIERIPYIYDAQRADEVTALVGKNISISRADWDSYETSWDFQSHPLAPTAYERREQFSYNINADARRKSVTLLSDRYERWAWACNARFDQLRRNEEELNRIFIDIYGLADELTPAVAERDVTVTHVYGTAADVPAEMKGSSYVLTRADAVRSLISYAVGCMFGRYSLDEEGIVYAGGEWDATCYKTFIPDADAIIPVCDDEYFIDDIAACFVSFVETVYGAETLEENLRFIADTLGGQGSPRTVIRSYFLRDFYADHVRRYRKRPIYWLFDSGEKNGFKALVYLHRYAPDTLARMRTDYIHPQQSRYQAALADAERLLTEAQGAERVQLTKRRTALRAQEEELHAYEERVHHLADQMIALDLDDGVRHNYALLQDVLAKLK